MKPPNIKNMNVKGKRVLLRVDFNVLMKNGKVIDDFRIMRTLPTIKLLKKGGAKIILISHFSAGRAKSLRPVAKFLSTQMKIDFSPDVLGLKVEDKISKMKNGDVLLLENIRSDKREEKNDKVFAKQLAGSGDIYVNDAFSVSHRKHASIVAITKYLPSYAGLLFEEELKNLQIAFSPKHPFLLILGGIKFGIKLGVLERFIKTADTIFVGGALSNNFFKEQGLDVGRSMVDTGVNIKKYLDNPKIMLPVDVRKKGGVILDCGPNTVRALSDVISRSKFILWNGPLGDFEKRGFEKGTEGVARAIAKSSAISIVGGGDTVAAIAKLGVLKKFSFVSTGGGAMLEFLAKGTLPGIEALKK